jgi:putative aldouronate transport system permease protein
MVERSRQKMLAIGKNKKRIKMSLGDCAFSTVNYLVIGFFSILCILPILYVIGYSITPYEDYLKNPLRMIPASPTLVAYKELIAFPLMRTGLYSTLFITIVGTLINIFMLCVTAYPLSKKHLKGRNTVMYFITFTMFFGGGMIPNYLLLRQLHLLNTYWALILPGSVSAYNLILMRNFISSIPASLEESAIIDGANEMQVLWKIIIPLCKPALATFTLFHAVGHWNSYFSSILYISDRKKWPLMLIVREMVISSGTSMIEQGSTAAADELSRPFTLKMAIIVATILPIVCVYPFLQKYFMKGMMLGSVKE